MAKKTDQLPESKESLDSDCLEAFDYVYAYINNELVDEADLARIEHHLSHCKSCYSRAEMERQINERMRQSKEDKTPDKLKKRLRNLIDEL